MNIILATLNSKFTHTSLALRDLSVFLKANNIPNSIVEYTINSDVFELLGDLYRMKPDVLCLSTYIWNANEMSYLAEQLKKVLPKCHILFGGPEVSYDAVTFLKEHVYADAVIQGEGEWTLCAYLDALLTDGLKISESFEGRQKLQAISGLAFRHADGISFTPQTNQLPKLDDIPFPYESFEGLEHRILYYESSRGCPFNCSYCLSSATKGIRFISQERLESDLLTFLQAKVKQVKFIDRTFNADPERALKIFKFLACQDNGITNFHFEITAHMLRDEDIAFLNTVRPGLFQFEIGIQSTMSEANQAVNRPLSFEALKEKVSRLLIPNNIHIHLDLIAGLPMETYGRFLKSVDDVFGLRPHMLQLGFLKMIKGSVIREHADLYGYVFDNQPPYEVIQNQFLSYDEMLLLKDIESVVDHVWNSKHFIKTIEDVLSHYQYPSQFLSDFSSWLRKQGYLSAAHKHEAWYGWLLEFATLNDYATPSLKASLVWDWMTAFGKIPPEWMVDFIDVKQEVFAYVKTDAFISQFKEFEDIPAKEVVKKLRFTAIHETLDRVVDTSGADELPPYWILIVNVLKRHPIDGTYAATVIRGQYYENQ